MPHIVMVTIASGIPPTDDLLAHSWSGAGEEAIPMLHFNGDSVDSIGIRDPSRSGTHPPWFRSARIWGVSTEPLTRP